MKEVTMNRRVRLYGSLGRWGVLLFLVTVVTGCSGGGYSGPTGTVNGTVNRAEKPVPAGCRVSFVSDGGFTATGQVDGSGKYTLASVGTSAIPAATYKVTVTPPPERELSEAEYEEAMANGTIGTPGPAAELIPAKYQNLATSGLSFEVKAGSNTIDIQLE